MSLVTEVIIPGRPCAMVDNTQTVLVAAAVVRATRQPVRVVHWIVVTILHEPAPVVLCDHVRAGDPVNLVNVRACRYWGSFSVFFFFIYNMRTFS